MCTYISGLSYQAISPKAENNCSRYKMFPWSWSVKETIPCQSSRLQLLCQGKSCVQRPMREWYVGRHYPANDRGYRHTFPTLSSPNRPIWLTLKCCACGINFLGSGCHKGRDLAASNHCLCILEIIPRNKQKQTIFPCFFSVCIDWVMYVFSFLSARWEVWGIRRVLVLEAKLLIRD